MSDSYRNECEIVSFFYEEMTKHVFVRPSSLWHRFKKSICQWSMKCALSTAGNLPPEDLGVMFMTGLFYRTLVPDRGRQVRTSHHIYKRTL